MKKRVLKISVIGAVLLIAMFLFVDKGSIQYKQNLISPDLIEKGKESREEKYRFAEDREKHEFNFQKSPRTGIIPLDQKEQELQVAIESRIQARLSRSSQNDFISRGPSNLGGRTRAIKVDLSDNTGNTLLAGGVSSGLFRTTDGGASWTKVSANDEIHNVTALAQDPRPGFQNIWYYGTGEWSGNSASLGGSYRGQGIWRSQDGGLSWSQMELTDSEFTQFDSFFDYVNNLQVHPITGELFVAVTGRIYRYDGNSFVLELQEPETNVGWTDVSIASDGAVYVSFDDSDSSSRGVWTSLNGMGGWSRIAQKFNPIGWISGGSSRTVLATAPSNPNILYALYDNGISGAIEAGLWRYDASTATWTNYSSKLPDEPGGDLSGNDPFAIQGGYDLVLSVNPSNENFVLIGGTNAYKIDDITDSNKEFVRIGGYNDNQSYALYQRDGDTHHPDLHAFEFDPFDVGSNILYTGSDGGVHRTTNVYAEEVLWDNLNNNYQTYQFYHVAMDPTPGSNGIMGGTQDNGTPIGGTDYGLDNNTQMFTYFGGDGVATGIARRQSGTEIQLYYGSQNGNIRTNYPNFRSIIPEGSSSQFVTYFYLDPDNTNALYYAGLSTLYVTNDAENVQTNTWTNLGTLPSGENIRTFATTPGIYNPVISKLFIGGNDGGLFRLSDPQNSVSLIGLEDITPTGASNNTILSGIAIHPTNPDIMLVVYSNYDTDNIFISENATAASPNWLLVERNLDLHSIRSAAITEVNGETTYFVGTARGLYSSSDPENEDWSLEGPNTIGLAVVSGLVYRHADGKLLVGTHGNGMFETTVGALSNEEFALNNTDLKLYPNPTIDKITITSKSLAGELSKEFEIYNLTGAIVKKGTMNVNNEVSVEDLASGTYFIKLTKDSSISTLKFIKR